MRILSSIFFVLIFLAFPTAYVSAAACSSLTGATISGFWDFDESSGNAADATGNGNTLTNNGSATYSAGLINNAVNLGNPNTSKYMSGGNMGIGGTADKSISIWVKLATEITSTINTEFFYSFRSTIGTASLVQLQYTYNGGSPILSLNDGGTVTNYSVSLGTGWHHIVYTRLGTAGTMYLDNVSVISETGAASGGTDNYFQEGAAAGSFFTNALFDASGIWSCALTSGQVSTLYNGGAGLQYPFSSTAATLPALQMMYGWW